MIVQCDKCTAKFRLDDSKVKEGGVKVRCSKCSNIFVVRKETPAEEADFDSFLSGLMPPTETASEVPEGAAPAASAAAEPEVPETGRQPAAVMPPEEEQIPVQKPTEQDDFDLSEFAFDDRAFGSEPPPVGPEEEKGGSGEEIVFGELDLSGTAAAENKSEVPEKGTGDVSRDEFAFSDEPDRPATELELDIDGIDLFAATEKTDAETAVPQEFSFETEPADQKIPETGKDVFGKTLGDFSFETETAELETPQLPAGQEKKVGPSAPFDFSQFEFGAEAEKETSVTGFPRGEVRGKTAQEEPAFDRMSADFLAGTPVSEEEMPPLSIASRRKGGSSLPIAVTAICILLVLLLAGGGFFFFKEGSAAFNKLGLGFMATWFGAESREEGGIAVRNTTGMFLVNKEAGEIFAVTGEAVNNFGKPRASIQVKVTLFGPNGAQVAQKTAYCGNALSRDQLVSLPFAKLETAMNNQFGDSLSNLAVQPGKGIPFAVVLTNVPKETSEFGVEVVGSTVASQ